MAALLQTLSPLLLLLLFLLALLHHSPEAIAAGVATINSFSASDSPWTPTDNQILVSPNRTFAAGFIPSKSNYYFAVWINKSADNFTVWSMFKDTPFAASTQLSISASGNLSLSSSSGRIIWRASAGKTSSPQLNLTERGNLLFGNWDSFDYPNDTLLANQTIPPATSTPNTLINGRYRFVNATSLYVTVNGVNESYWSEGAGGGAALKNITSDGQLIFADNSNLIADDFGDNTVLVRRLTLESDGNLRLYSLMKGQWRLVWQAVQELCTIRGTCGPNAICQPEGSDSITCVCPPGFNRTGSGPATSGCVLKINYTNQWANTKFLRLDFVDFGLNPDPNPDPNRVPKGPLNYENCKSLCMRNDTCVGFGYKYTGTRDCFIYSGPLYDGYWSPAKEIATYLRVSNSETATTNYTGMTEMINTVCPVNITLPEPPKHHNTTARNISIITILFSLELLAGVLSFWAFLRKYSKYRDMARTFGLEYLPTGGPRRFSYAELKTATNDFLNVVGRGGYGVVYKGQLPDGRAIAVKRLRNVGGGEAEFWAEVTIIARMHHLNLVRMWGFCADKEQRMLVYEYVSNGSLDKFLFPHKPGIGIETQTNAGIENKNPKPLLDWNTRYRIALGVARAIAYLHEECLEWVLHCDIKPENILLEDDFCPKVSDFGLSKLTNKKDKVTMSKIRGTRGYMAPEWVINREPITAKADVYSFGMVLLEIVSGRRNYDFRQDSVESEDWYFPKWAFEKVYVERKLEEILDPRIMEGEEWDETVERMVKTAMWCLQDRAEMRPSMGKVAKMLEGTIEITEPAKPTIFCMPDD